MTNRRYERLPEGPLPIHDAVTLALDYCNFGRLDFCDTLCARVLQADPNHLLARLVQGLSAHKRRDNPRAVALLRQVTEMAPRFPDAHLHLANALFWLGRFDAAVAAYTQALALRPDYPEALAGLGEVLRRRGCAGEAAPLLRQAVALKPNYSPSYISYSLIGFERSLPPGETLPPRRAARSDRPAISMASLGNYGRFAQTVNEYVAMRLYAERYGLEFLTPDWVGHAFFAVDDPALDPAVQPRSEEWLTQRDVFAEGFDGTVAEPFRDCDVFLGGSPVDTLRREHRETVQGWLTPRACWRGYLEPPVECLRARGRTLVALHIRRTDWWNQAYSPLQIYGDWLDRVWGDLDDPVLFVSTDDPSVVPEFARFRPATSDDFPVRWEGLEYLQDFHVLSQADVVAISTGAFAQTAVALNRNARLLLKPGEDNGALVPFEPWG